MDASAFRKLAHPPAVGAKFTCPLTWVQETLGSTTCASLITPVDEQIRASLGNLCIGAI
jgi:hypothetical protein